MKRKERKVEFPNLSKSMNEAAEAFFARKGMVRLKKRGFIHIKKGEKR